MMANNTQFDFTEIVQGFCYIWTPSPDVAELEASAMMPSEDANAELLPDDDNFMSPYHPVHLNENADVGHCLFNAQRLSTLPRRVRNIIFRTLIQILLGFNQISIVHHRERGSHNPNRNPQLWTFLPLACYVSRQVYHECLVATMGIGFQVKDTADRDWLNGFLSSPPLLDAHNWLQRVTLLDYGRNVLVNLKFIASLPRLTNLGIGISTRDLVTRVVADNKDIGLLEVHSLARLVKRFHFSKLCRKASVRVLTVYFYDDHRVYRNCIQDPLDLVPELQRVLEEGFRAAGKEVRVKVVIYGGRYTSDGRRELV